MKHFDIMKYKLSSFIIFATTIILAIACEKVEYETQDEVSLSASMGEEPGWYAQTKGSPITAISSIGDFGVTISEGNSGVFSSMSWIKATMGSGEWTLAKQFRWPTKKTLNFYALHPYTMSSSSTIRGNLTDPVATKKVTFTYDARKVESGSLPDLLFGFYSGTGTDIDSGTRSGKRKAELKFYHPLSGIQFIAGSDLNGVTVKSIGIFNVKTVSTCTVTCSGSTPSFSWSTPTTLCDYYFSPNAAYSSGAIIGGASKTMMLIPQALPTNSLLVLQTANGGYVASLSGVTLTTEKLYKITLAHNGVTFTSTGEPECFIPWEQ